MYILSQGLHQPDGAPGTLQQDVQLVQDGAAWQRQGQCAALQSLQQDGSGAAIDTAGDTAPHRPAAYGGATKSGTRKRKRGSKGARHRERGVQNRLRKERERAAAAAAAAAVQ